jgi:ABC-type Na+ efflux pump permease subunit
MNKAIFLFTMKRYLRWSVLLLGGSLLLLMSLILGAMLFSDYRMTNEMVRVLLCGPTMPIVVAYSVISPQIANSQRRKDGEYLSLIFSRPISRYSYVMTKWLSGSLLTLTIMSLATAIAFGVAAFAGHCPSGIIDGYAVVDAVLNCFSYTAVVVLVSSLPYLWGAIAMGAVFYGTIILSVTIGSLQFLSSFTFSEGSQVLIAVGKSIISTVSVGIDTYHVINTSPFPVADFAVYISNVVLYLTLSVFVMSKREFFYAND